jgi:hypothetical protein
VTPTQSSGGSLGPGSIAFTGLSFNGDSQIAFVSTTALAANQTIYFTNYTCDNTLNELVDEDFSCCTSGKNGVTVVEGVIAYNTGSSGLPAYNTVVIGNPSDETNVLGPSGSVSLVCGNVGATTDDYLIFNHNGNGQKAIAFITNSTLPSTPPISTSGLTFLAAVNFGPVSFLPNTSEPGPVAITSPESATVPPFFETNYPPGLDSTTSTDLAGYWTPSSNLVADEVVANENDIAILTGCITTLSSIVNPANWQVDGNEGKTSVNFSPAVVATPCASGGAGFNGTLPNT